MCVSCHCKASCEKVMEDFGLQPSDAPAVVAAQFTKKPHAKFRMHDAKNFKPKGQVVDEGLLREFVLAEDRGALAKSLTGCIRSRCDVMGIEVCPKSLHGNGLLTNKVRSATSQPLGAKRAH